MRFVVDLSETGLCDEEYAQYMRGDKIGDGREGDTIDEYLHAYYPDIEDRYPNEIYRLLQ